MNKRQFSKVLSVAIQHYTYNPGSLGSVYMCVAINIAFNHFEISALEKRQSIAEISRLINGQRTLHGYLKSKGMHATKQNKLDFWLEHILPEHRENFSK